jgi:pimeloyl-ACP methyl ester carboxylesterase
MIEAPDEQFADLGDVTLCYETFGDPQGVPLLLVMGLGTQMLGWHSGFCRELADRGHFVIRYDNRDSGRSTRFDGVKPPGPLELATRRIAKPAYLLSDLAADGIGLLDHLGIERAHVVGASMGGMIAQVMAARWPDRVLTLTSIMSMTGARWKGQPALRAYPFLLAKPPKSKEEAVKRTLALYEVVGSPGFDRDVDELRASSELAWDRGPSAAGTGRQLGAILASGDRTTEVSAIRAPTLVIHGTSDRLVNVSGGKATAKAIPGAKLELIDGMGHDLPRGVWPRIVGAISEHTAAAGAGAGAGV